MARAIWDGEISFGLINIQVELYSAVNLNHISFHLLDSRDRSRVRYVRINEETGEEVPWKNIAKGYEYADDQYVVLSKEDLQDIKPELTQSIELEEFVDMGDIPILLFDKPYYLVPGEKSRKSYVLLREVLKQKNKVGVGRVVIRSKEYIVALFPIENALVLNLLLFPQEIRSMEEFDFPSSDLVEEKIRPKEIELSSQLIDSMTATWNPEKYHDEYREALQEWIEEKIKTVEEPKKKSRKRAAAKENDNIIDIAALLEKSLKANKGGRSKRTRKGS